MNVIDLPDLMREYAGEDPEPIPVERRIDEIRRRVVTTRRRQTIGAVAAIVVLALLGAGIAGNALPDSHRKPVAPAIRPTTPARSTRPFAFPSFRGGEVLFAKVTGKLQGKPLTISIPSAPLPIELGMVCSESSFQQVVVDVSVNGHDEGFSTCTDTLDSLGGFGTAGTGLHAGDPATYTFTIEDGSSLVPVTPHPVSPVPSGTYEIGFYKAAPVDSYPLPPRPAKLPVPDVTALKTFQETVEDQYGTHVIVRTPEIVNSDPANPLAPMTYTFAYPGKSSSGSIEMAVASATPGYLTLTVNGTVIGSTAFYGYYQAGGPSPVDIFGRLGRLDLQRGELVTVTITPRLVTGPWQFGIWTKQ